MKYFYDVNFNEIMEWVLQADYPPYKAAQIYQWKAKGIYSFDDMSNIAIPMRVKLSKDYYIDGLLIEEKLESFLDGTVKYVFRMKDGNLIESVLMEYRHGYSVCISSQAGCKMGCSFCISSQAGFGRNLSSGEMLAQISIISRDSGKRVSNVVVMGIGEPFDNYEQLILFLKETQASDGLGIGMRHISVSTCGLVDEMLKFTEEGFPVTLSVSLHAPNDTIRMNLMPIAKRYPMSQLLEACRY
jgi:23S rRNA (adenine2503-C2)-methyltransferase